MKYFGYAYVKEVQEKVEVVEKFTEYLEQGKLMGTRCKKCGRFYLPPRKDCQCLAEDEMEWEEVPTEGTLAAYTVIHFAPESMSKQAPYVVGIVDLGENRRILLHLRGLMKPPEVGMKVKVKSEKISDNQIILKAVPA